MTLKNKIIQLLSGKKAAMSMKELYEYFPDIAKTTVRGRVYENLGKGIQRIGKGLYISEEAIIEYGNSLEIIDRMVSEEDKFEFIFLDIPYDAYGQKGGKGGNRKLFALDKITPDQFAVFVSKCEKLLKSDNSLLIFMFTSGKSSRREHDKYLGKINLKQCLIKGSYQKLWSNGKPMNMGKFIMPYEHIYFFSKSGNFEADIIPDLDFKLTPDIKEYPTSKPYPMIKTLIEYFTKIGDWVFDPFGGSGKILKACLELKRFCHIIDNSEKSVNGFLIPLLSNKYNYINVT